jgi:aspartyl-tRNA synthetase
MRSEAAMLDQLGEWTRTDTCGALRASDIGRDVTLLGWVHRVRDLGALVFLDVRDQKNHSGDAVNPRMPTGEIEVAAVELRVLNDAAVPPFQIADEAALASDDLRLRYRYLDLRRPALQANIGLRNRVTMAVRRYFDAQGFWEVETPVLGKSTPEGRATTSCRAGCTRASSTPCRSRRRSSSRS